VKRRRALSASSSLQSGTPVAVVEHDCCGANSGAASDMNTILAAIEDGGRTLFGRGNPALKIHPKTATAELSSGRADEVPRRHLAYSEADGAAPIRGSRSHHYFFIFFFFAFFAMARFLCLLDG
jgi:hypothetical protein